jgi:hypothetical protein
MHSVVVLGDTRSHWVKIKVAAYWDNTKCGPQIPHAEYWFRGGAYIVNSAIQTICKKQFSVHSYLNRSEQDKFSHTCYWELFPFQLTDRFFADFSG